MKNSVSKALQFCRQATSNSNQDDIQLAALVALRYSYITLHY